MKVTYELTREDLAALTVFHLRTSPMARRKAFGCIAASFGGLMILPAGILLTADKPVLETAIDIWPLLAGPILFAVCAIPFLRWRARQVSNQLLSEGRKQDCSGTCVLEAGDDALTETQPSGSTSRRWASVERIVTTPAHLFVYTSGMEAYVVPRRAFHTESDFIAFVDVVRARSGVEVQASDGA